MTSSHSCSLMLKIMRSRRMPATLTRMSSRPQLSSAVLIEASPPSTVATVSKFGDGLAAGRLDLVDDLCGRAGVGAAAVDVDAGVVDDDARALRREEHRDAAADAASGAGDDRSCRPSSRSHQRAPPVPALRQRSRRRPGMSRSGGGGAGFAMPAISCVRHHCVQLVERPHARLAERAHRQRVVGDARRCRRRRGRSGR